MRRATAIFAVFGVFAAGVLVGVMAAHLFYAQRLLRPGAPPEMGGRLFHRYLERRLELSEAQSDEVREILRRGHERAAALRQETWPRVREVMLETTRELEAVLDEEQRERFRELRRRQRRRADQFLLGPPGPPGHRGWGPGHRRHGPPPHDPPPAPVEDQQQRGR